jgi:hypothetical protein
MPKFAAALCLLAPLSAAAAYADDDLEPRARAVMPREIVTAGLPAPGGRARCGATVSIADERRLAELVSDGEARAAILRKVEFRKERLLLFRWEGSGADRLAPAQGRPGEANFEYVCGMTADLFSHARLFAVPLEAKVKVTAP